MKKLVLFLIAVSAFYLKAQQTVPSEEQLYFEEYGTTIQNFADPFVPPFPDASTWNALPAAPNAFGRTIIGAIGEYVYVFASQNAESMAGAFHMPTLSWTASTPCLFPAFNSAYCVANGELYKFSGTGAVSNFEKFTPAGNGTGTWTSLTPTSSTLMTSQSAIVWDGGNYIYAYSSGISSPYPSYFSRFHITNQTWETRASSLYPRRYAGMACINGFIYLLGGLKSDASADNICQKYDIATDTWSEIAPAPESLNFTKWTVSTDNRHIWLIGSGGGYSSGALSSNVYYYDPSTNTWALESVLPAPRGLATGVVVTNYGKIFWGGGNDGTSGTNFQNNVWEGVGGAYIPVELTMFTATADRDGITLNWRTASETNNNRFEIERSRDRINFEKAGSVPGAGTTTEVNGYTFTDKLCETGRYYYRLKQIDNDGSFAYSYTAEADLKDFEYQVLDAYPNPFNPSVTISYTVKSDGNVRIILTDILGGQVREIANEFRPAGKYELSFNAEGLPSGVYICRLYTADKLNAIKLILNK